jgi:hypothetical protein
MWVIFKQLFDRRAGVSGVRSYIRSRYPSTRPPNPGKYSYGSSIVRLFDRRGPEMTRTKPRHRRVRLTRRGRIVVGIVVALCCAGLTTLLIALAARPSQAAPAGGRTVETVVQPGDTLWRIAARELPGVEAYRAVDMIRELNGLRDYTVHPGERLLLPARR